MSHVSPAPDFAPRANSLADLAVEVADQVHATRALEPGRLAIANIEPGGALSTLIGQARALDATVQGMAGRSAAAAADVERRLGADVEAAYLHGFTHALVEVWALLRGLPGDVALELLRAKLGEARRSLPEPEAGAELTACRRAGQALASAHDQPSPF